MTGWPVATLESIAAGGLFVDGDWVETKDQDPSGDVRLTQLADVGVASFRDRSDRWLRSDQAAQLGCTFLAPGDLMIARMPDPLGRACLVPESIGRAVTAVDVAILRIARTDVDRRYVMWALNSPAIHSAIVGMQTGTTRKRISRRHLATISIPLPRLDEQRRIVDILEDHLSRLEAADGYLTRIARRMSVLHHQFLESGLARMNPGECRLADLLATGLANGRSVPSREGGFPVLRLTAVRGGRVDLNERKGGAWTADDARQFLVQSGDFLISRGNGSLGLVGRGGLVVDSPDPVAYPDTLIRARPNQAHLDPEYLALVWNAPSSRRQIEAAARTSAGIYKVNQKDLRSVLLPTIPIEKQRAVVEQVGAQRDALATVDAERNRALQRSSVLRRALLQAAFSGELSRRTSDNEKIEELAG